jgi:hypothetical protein
MFRLPRSLRAQRADRIETRGFDGGNPAERERVGGAIPNSRLARKRVAPRKAAIPATIPVTVRRSPSASISRRICPRVRFRAHGRFPRSAGRRSGIPIRRPPRTRGSRLRPQNRETPTLWSESGTGPGNQFVEEASPHLRVRGGRVKWGGGSSKIVGRTPGIGTRRFCDSAYQCPRCVVPTMPYFTLLLDSAILLTTSEYASGLRISAQYQRSMPLK